MLFRSHGARQVVLTSESDPARVMSLSGIEAEEGDEVYYTAFAGSLASLNIERAFSVTIEADGQEYPVKMVVVLEIKVLTLQSVHSGVTELMMLMHK